MRILGQPSFSPFKVVGERRGESNGAKFEVAPLTRGECVGREILRGSQTPLAIHLFSMVPLG